MSNWKSALYPKQQEECTDLEHDPNSAGFDSYKKILRTGVVHEWRCPGCGKVSNFMVKEKVVKPTTTATKPVATKPTKPVK